jgi:hypothetical protein
MTTSSKQKEQSFSPKETKRISILNSNSNSLEFQTREEETGRTNWDQRTKSHSKSENAFDELAIYKYTACS